MSGKGVPDENQGAARRAPTDRRRLRARRGGFSLAEVAVSTLLVGMILAGSMRAVTQSAMVRFHARERERAMLLAHELGSEILTKAYREPSGGGASSLGPDAGEASGANRTPFDDVDDYDGYVQSPCASSDGSPIPHTTGWSQSVVVHYVNPNNPTGFVLTDQGFKLVFISVTTDSGVQGYSTILRADVDKQVP